MNNGLKHHGLVVPWSLRLRKPAHWTNPPSSASLIFCSPAGVDGIFVLGTTGEGVSVPQTFRHRLVECAVARVKRRAKVYVGLSDLKNVALANGYFHAGADAVVARPPVSYPLDELLPSFQSLLSGLKDRSSYTTSPRRRMSRSRSTLSASWSDIRGSQE